MTHVVHLATPAAFTDSVGDIAQDLLRLPANHFHTVLADPPWRFDNRTGKVAPEHRRLRRYRTMTLDEICALPVARRLAEPAHSISGCPNALLPDGLAVMEAWGFAYKSNIVWHKVRKDGGSDGRGVGFYFRNVTELMLFGVRGKNARTLAPGRRQVNFIETRKREHSPQAGRAIRADRGVLARRRFSSCSPAPTRRTGLFPCRQRPWMRLGDEADDETVAAAVNH